MKNEIKKFVKQNGISVLLSVLLPMLILVIVYYRLDIYPGGPRTLLTSDGFAQFSNFHASFNNMLHGKQNLFYTWSGSLGLNYYALASYYLGSIFTPIVFFFDNQNIADALYFITLFNFGAMGLSFWVYAHNTFKLPKPLTVGLSVSYAFMSFATAYSPVIMWLDALIYLPLIILGINRLMDQKKPVLLFISYLLMFLSNFYMAFMVGVFSFLYFLARAFSKQQFNIKTVSNYFVTSILAGGASMIVILPTIFDLSSNGESLTEINRFWTKDSNVVNLIAKNMLGVYDSAKYEGSPFIYVGLLPLVFCLFYFFSKKIALKEKLLYGSLLAFLLVSFFIEPLNLFWHGLHSPNMFLYRFSFLFSFTVIMLAGYGLEQFSFKEMSKLENAFIGIFLSITVVALLGERVGIDYLDKVTLAFTFSFLVIYILLFFIRKRRANWHRFLVVLLGLIMIGEALINTVGTIGGIGVEWRYAARSSFSGSYKEIKGLVDYTKENNEGYYRLENLNNVTSNDSFTYGYNGISMFSSIRNRHSSSFLGDLGFNSKGTNLTIHYLNNTILMDALLGVKYNIARENPMKYGYELDKKEGKFQLYKNQYTLPLGILNDKDYLDEEYIQNQTALFQSLAESEEDYNDELFNMLSVRQEGTKNMKVTTNDDEIILKAKNPKEKKEITWEVDVPANVQAYLSIFPAGGAKVNETHASLSIRVEENTRKFRLRDSGGYFSLGCYEQPTTVKVVMSYSGSKAINIQQPEVAVMSTKLFDKGIKKIQSKGVDFTTEGRKAHAKVDLKEPKTLLTTIPYDKGWKAYSNGKQLEVHPFKDAFISLDLPEGQQEIKLVFLPYGFKVGTVLFVVCTLLFVGYSYWLRKKNMADKME